MGRFWMTKLDWNSRFILYKRSSVLNRTTDLNFVSNTQIGFEYFRPNSDHYARPSRCFRFCLWWWSWSGALVALAIRLRERRDTPSFALIGSLLDWHSNETNSTCMIFVRLSPHWIFEHEILNDQCNLNEDTLGFRAN